MSTALPLRLLVAVSNLTIPRIARSQVWELVLGGGQGIEAEPLEEHKGSPEAMVVNRVLVRKKDKRCSSRARKDNET